MPSISIIIPSYNYGKYISETLASIEKEISAEDEVIIVDDGSADNTRQVVTDWIQGKSNFRYLHQENQGPSAARNAGLDQANNEYSYFLDSDDCPLPGKLDILKDAATRQPDAAMIIGGHMTYDASGKKKIHKVGALSDDTRENFIQYAIKKNFGIANGGCVLVKTDIARRYRYPSHLRLSDDICLYSWILANHSCVTVDETIIAIRKHGDSLRHQLDIYEKSIESLADTLFDPKLLSGDLLSLRDPFEHHLQLSLFRAQFRSGNKKQARRTYLKAIKDKPTAIFKRSYFSKFLRCFG